MQRALRSTVVKVGFGLHFEIGLRPISLLVGELPTKTKIGSWSERMISHTGIEIRSRLLREAAVRNFAQWAKA